MNILDEMLKVKSFKEIDLNTHISLKNKYVFFQVSKVASSTIKGHLQQLEVKGTGRSVIDVNNRYVSPHVWPSQLSTSSFLNVLGGEEFKKVSFVRNPYSRLLSCYLHRIIRDVNSPSNKWLYNYTGGLCGPDISFSDFVKVVCSQRSIDQESHWRRQSDEIFFKLIPNWVFIGRFENLSEDIDKMERAAFGSSEVDFDSNENLSPMSTGAADKVGIYYTDDLQELVYNSYQQDFLNFGYSKDI